MAKIRTIEYGSWSEFKANLFQELFGEPHFTQGRFLFRGVGDASWSLTTSFDRWFQIWGHGQVRFTLANQLVQEFLESCDDEGLLTQVKPSSPEAIALAQHYGIPTRLLDWTESPYVAAFFAYHTHLVLDADPNESVAVWALDRSAPIWSQEQGVELLRVPRLSNIRLRNQAGMFTLSRTPFEKLEEFVQHHEWDGIALYRFVLYAQQVGTALSDLRAMGITPARLFPGLEGAAAAALQRLILQSKQFKR